MKQFILSDRMEKSDVRLAKMVVTDQTIHVNYKEVDVGFPAGKSLKESKGSERQKMEFKMSAKNC